MAKRQSNQVNQSRPFSFFTRPEYYKELADKISQTKKGDDVYVCTMGFNPDEILVQQILHELKEASGRGVNVLLMVDAFTFLLKRGVVPGPLWFSTSFPRKLKGSFSTKLAALEGLKNNGGRYVITNMPSQRFSTPFAGRSHMKFAVINDFVFVGGCNLTTVDHLDMMAARTDKVTASILKALAEKVFKTRSLQSALVKDSEVVLDTTTTLLLDAGSKGSSLIYQEALALIDAAEESITITCQYFPNKATARHLTQAHNRGVKVTLIYNHPDQHPFPLNFLHRGVIRAEKLKYPKALFKYQLPRDHNFLHAKLLSSEKATIVGSHNYVEAGVKFGTAELALKSVDPDFGSRAVYMLQEQVPVA